MMPWMICIGLEIVHLVRNGEFLTVAYEKDDFSRA